MKFLVLALCVCAASAATFSSFKPYGNTAAAVATSVVTAPVVAAQAAYDVAAPVAKTIAKATYETGKEAAAAILRQDSEVNSENFNYLYETQNGIAAQATGAVKRVGDVNVLTSQGTYRYVSPDGTPVEVSYIADENGFQPQGNVLPVGPEVPEYIVRALAYIAAHPKPVDSKY